jgi:molybdopterin synthase sulfur carrier subunit
MVRISIPPTLRKLCGGEDAVQVRPGTVADAISQLQNRFNGVRERLCDDRGQLRGSVLVFVNDEDVRFLQAQLTPLRPGDEVSIVPAFAGG